jgi:hypothetical protein
MLSTSIIVLPLRTQYGQVAAVAPHDISLKLDPCGFVPLIEDLSLSDHGKRQLNGRSVQLNHIHAIRPQNCCQRVRQPGAEARQILGLVC